MAIIMRIHSTANPWIATSSMRHDLFPWLSQVDSTNVGNVVTVRFNIVSRHAYPGDWGWVLGGVDPSVILEEANALSPSETTSVFEERWLCINIIVESVEHSTGFSLTAPIHYCTVSGHTIRPFRHIYTHAGQRSHPAVFFQDRKKDFKL